jgi:WD40 repeat protein
MNEPVGDRSGQNPENKTAAGEIPPDQAETMPPSPAATMPSGAVHSFGDYELLAEIARGGMGVVYRARQVSLNRPVALKMILAGRLASAADVQRFRLEAEAAALLDHPNILPIYEVGDYQGQYFFSMKLVDGGNLTSFSREPAAGVAAWQRAALVVARVARAVHFAHQRGILHRDLKPANILLDEGGHPYVTDFGLAKRVQGDSGLTQSGAILGTPAYMAPEQARAEKGLSTAVDIYSLGAILYHLLTGQPPFRGATELDTLFAVQHGEPRRPRSLAPGLPGDLETICLKCLQKDPNQRYSSADALANDLERWLEGEPIQARPVGRAERLYRWCWRNPAVAALTTLAVIALVVGITLSSYFALRAADEAGQAREQTGLAQTESLRAREAEERARQNELTVRQNLYLSQMSQAHRSWQAGQVARVQELLDAQDPERTAGHDFRGFEWHYLRRLLHSERFTFRQPGSLCTPGFVTFRPGTAEVAWAERGPAGPAGKAAQVHLWDGYTGKPIRTFPGQSIAVFSPNGKYLATGSSDGAAESITILDVDSGQKRATIPARHSCVFSPDSKRLAAVIAIPAPDWNSVRIWDLVSGKVLATYPSNGEVILALALSPDGKLLGVGGSLREENFLDIVGLRRSRRVGHLRIVETQTGKERWMVGKEQLAEVTALAFSPDSTRLVSVCKGDAAPRIWDTASGKELLALNGHTHIVSAIAFSQDGKTLASASLDQTARLWDAFDGRPLRVYRGHMAPVVSVAFQAEGKLLATASEDGSVKIWDSTRDQDGQSFPLPNERINSLAFAPASDRLAVGTSGLGVWDVAAARWVREVAPAPGKQAFVIAAYGRQGRSLVSFATLELTSDVQNLIFRAGGKGLLNLIHRNSRSEITVFDADSKVPRLLKIKGSGFLPTLNPSGKHLALMAADGTVDLLDLDSGKRTMAVKSTKDWRATALAFSPDGKWLALAESLVSEPRRARIVVNELAGAASKVSLPEVEGKIIALAFTRDGGRVLAAAEENMYGWDLRTRREVNRFRLDGPVFTAAFSPDGKRMATFRGDGRVLLWDLETGAQILGLTPFGHWVSVMAFSDDGLRLAAGGTRLTEGASSTVTIWDASPPGP